MAMKPEEIVTDAELDKASGYANFGAASKRDVVAYGLLQTACGYHTGGTCRSILEDLGLINRPRLPHAVPSLLKKGRKYLWAAFGRKSF